MNKKIFHIFKITVVSLNMLSDVIIVGIWKRKNLNAALLLLFSLFIFQTTHAADDPLQSEQAYSFWLHNKTEAIRKNESSSHLAQCV